MLGFRWFGALALMLALISGCVADTAYYKVRNCNITMTRKGTTTVNVRGEMLGVTGRNLTFGIKANNFTVNKQVANALIDLADTHNTMSRVKFTVKVNYDAKVWVNFTEVGEMSIKFSGVANVPAAKDWPADLLEAQGVISFLELPWIKFKNVTRPDEKTGIPGPFPVEVQLDKSGLGKTALFNHSDGVFHSAINAIEAAVPSSSEIKRSRKVPRDFVGFAMEWSNAAWFFRKPGTSRSALAINQNVVRAVKNLGHLNIGVNGNSGMLVFLTTSQLSRQELDKYTGARELLDIYPDDFRMLDKVADQSGAVFIVGAPLLHPTDSRYIVEFITQGILKYIKHKNIYAIEAGNEPDHWAMDKKGFRSAPFTYDEYMTELQRHANAVGKAWPKNIPFQFGAGPAIAGCNTFKEKVCWQPYLYDFAKRASRFFKYVTYHRYGNSGCSSSTNHETLLGDPDPNTGDFKWVEDLVPKLDTIGRKLVWGEGNALSCGGKEEVSDSFAATLWMLDNLFEAAVRGVYKANVHADPTHDYSPFQVDQRNGNVKVMPVFYGMLAFTRLFEDGDSSIFKLRSKVQSRYIKIWGVETESGNIRVLVLHKDLKAKSSLTLKITLDKPGDFKDQAQIARITAPSYTSKTGIKIAGQTFDGSSDGTLRGKKQIESVAMKNGGFTITVPKISGMMLFITKKSSRSSDIPFRRAEVEVEES